MEITSEQIKVLCKVSMYQLTLRYLGNYTKDGRIFELDREHTYYLLTYLNKNWRTWLYDSLSGNCLYSNCNDIVINDLEDVGILPS